MSDENRGDQPIAIANCDEAAARAALSVGANKPLQMFFLELPSGWLWLRVEPESLEYLYSLKLSGRQQSASAKADCHEEQTTQVLDLVANPLWLEKFAAGQAEIIYWRRPWSSEVDQRDWKPLHQWLEEQFNGLRS
jgi:hypothetical protein